MSSDPNFLDIVLLGKDYRIACPPEEQESLRVTVSYVDAKMHEIVEKTKSNIAERIAVMAALSIAHELLAQKSAEADFSSSLPQGLEATPTKRRLEAMEAQLDAVLALQTKLFS